MTHENLLSAALPETKLPVDPAAAELEELEADLVVRSFPASSLVWAELAEDALATDDDVAAYAYARTGYHRGLDALRAAGWRGQGPIPWEHEPNRGFLRALWALAVAAQRLEEYDEASRCQQFLRDSSPTAWAEVTGVEEDVELVGEPDEDPTPEA